MTVRVVAALRDSGGLKAGTPLATASTPVRATEPLAKARSSSSTVTAWSGVGSAWHGVDRLDPGALEDDAVGADADHEQCAAHEEVGGQGEDVARLAHAPQVAEGHDEMKRTPRGTVQASRSGSAEVIWATADDVETATVRM